MTDHKDARQLLATQPAPKATWKEAVTFLENAARNWRTFPKLSQADLEDVATALDHYCAKQHQRIAELEAERQWRSIDTAPKDGTTIQAWHTIHKCLISIRWVEEGYQFQGETLHWFEKSFTTAWPESAFSHWMPLPASPHEGTQS